MTTTHTRASSFLQCVGGRGVVALVTCMCQFVVSLESNVSIHPPSDSIWTLHILFRQIMASQNEKFRNSTDFKCRMIKGMSISFEEKLMGMDREASGRG